MGQNRFSFSLFEFDTASLILTRNGRYLSVPRQTAQLLAILLERAGAVVSREELQQLLWPDGEFIDHQHAINRAVNHLRMVLRDDARKPQYIETLPKRGYRFAAEVKPVSAMDTMVAEPASKGLTEPIRPPVAIAEVALPSETVPAAELQAPSLRSHPSIFARVWRFLPRGGWIAIPVLGVAVIAAVTIFVAQRVKAKPDVVSLAILPFQHEGDGAEQLGDSFRLDLSDTLSQLPNVQVRASHSLASMKADDESLRAASQNLHLDAFLVGRLALHDKQCTLAFELVRGRDAVHLASFQYSGSINELASIRDKVQRGVFSALQVTDKSIQAGSGSTQDPQAYGAYLQARDLAHQRTIPSLNGAIAQYRVATERDPGFARAYAGMATAQLALASSGGWIEHYRLAQTFAQKALQLDPNLAEAHGVLGFVAIRADWDKVKAESELRRAVQLEPYQAAYHGWLAEFLAEEGRVAEAYQQSDPLWPHVYTFEQFVAAAGRDFPRQIQAAKRYAAFLPDLPLAHDRLAWALFVAGRYEEAIGEWRAMAVQEKDQERIALEDRGLAALRQGGIAAYSAVRLNAITDHLDTAASHPEDFEPAEWYAYTGNSDRAIAELDKKVSEHDPSAIDMTVNPMFDNLRRDARFVALLNKVGLKIPAKTPQNLSASLK
jgi:DNA-binding winged helix-turn-helix (wHTH) protein/TolB-like protein/Tfp pilus assembly protein PilF